jgi:hypothetical protein
MLGVCISIEHTIHHLGLHGPLCYCQYNDSLGDDWKKYYTHCILGRVNLECTIILRGQGM